MNQANHNSSLTIGTDRFRTTELEAANDYINNHVTPHQVDVLDTDSGVAFDCKRWHVGGFQVCDFSYGECAVEVTIDKCEEHGFFIVIPLRGKANVSSQGEKFSLTPGSAMAFTTPEAVNTSFVDSKFFRNINIGMSYESLQSFLTNEFDLPITRNISFSKEPIKVNNEFRFLINYVEWLSSQINDDVTSMLNNTSHPAHHMHDMLMSLLVSTFDNNYQELYSNQNNNSVSPIYVRLAEEFMREKACEAITVNDVAREVGVAMRTLHMGFQRYRNYSVSEFLRNERLSLARKELATAKERHLSVTNIAYSCGFTHLSKFAIAYQKRYGEKPSETLRKGG